MYRAPSSMVLNASQRVAITSYGFAALFIARKGIVRRRETGGPSAFSKPKGVKYSTVVVDRLQLLIRALNLPEKAAAGVCRTWLAYRVSRSLRI